MSSSFSCRGCVCVCVCACMRECVYTRVYASECACACTCACLAGGWVGRRACGVRMCRVCTCIQLTRPISHLQEQETAAEADENVQRLVAKKADLEAHITELVERLDEEVDNNANISAARRKLEAELDNIQEDLEEANQQLDMVNSSQLLPLKGINSNWVGRAGGGRSPYSSLV